ncbi:TIR domain-containing protein [Parasediminibacterium sp. JCM 36343]|uniref:TIR domain-containing protein n=1 Tax=Parasediminibacterium sp. JCM 36343 TaxID=3374279 RepID=UPI00397CECDA
MANTCYACFDGDNDIHYYRLMQAWHANQKFAFTFVNAHDITQARDTSSEQTIKRSLRTRLNASDVFLVLIGESTKNLYRFVRWEMEIALEMGIPIIAVNLDGSKSINMDLCPPIIRNELVIHIPFGHKIIDYAIQNWPVSYKNLNSKDKSGPYIYPKSIYDELGL